MGSGFSVDIHCHCSSELPSWEREISGQIICRDSDVQFSISKEGVCKKPNLGKVVNVETMYKLKVLIKRVRRLPVRT